MTTTTMYGQSRIGDQSKRPGQYSSFIRWEDGTESPVFDSYYELSAWMRANGVVIDEHDKAGNGFIPWRVRKVVA